MITLVIAKGMSGGPPYGSHRSFELWKATALIEVHRFAASAWRGGAERVRL
jgi:hypothetical protein